MGLNAVTASAHCQESSTSSPPNTLLWRRENEPSPEPTEVLLALAASSNVSWELSCWKNRRLSRRFWQNEQENKQTKLAYASPPIPSPRRQDAVVVKEIFRECFVSEITLELKDTWNCLSYSCSVVLKCTQRQKCLEWDPYLVVVCS